MWIATMVLALGCRSSPSAPEPTLPPPDPGRGVHEVVPGIHVARGFGLANSILIEGTDGLVVVDTMESATAAREVLDAFRGISDAPIAAVIFTHNHGDHIFGSEIFATPGVPVYAHASTDAQIDRVVSVVGDALQVRTARMFGTALPDADRTSHSIGPALRFDMADVAMVRPTHTFDDHLAVEIAGVKIELVHAPGETDDQLFVWLPEEGVLLPGDNLYQSFPNLYTIRGTRPRDVGAWVNSLDAMRDRHPAVLIPSHTGPIVGSEAVDEVLTAYRDGIQYVHDQTVRGLNAGIDPVTLSTTIRLPAHLAEHPWLAETYGRVSWSVRAIADGYLGWFDADASDLDPLAPADRAQRYAAAFDLADATRTALTDGDLAWAAEVGRLWTLAAPDAPEAREALAQVYTAQAEATTNPNGAHWYRTAAAELRGTVTLVPTPRSRSSASLVETLSIAAVLEAMPTRLAAEDVLDVDQKLAITLTDLDETWVIHVRRGVAEVRMDPDADVPLGLVTTSLVFKRVAAEQLGVAAAVAAGDLSLRGNPLQVARFFGWFH